jgi:NADH-quinone oxidoreductase subunit N
MFLRLTELLRNITGSFAWLIPELVISGGILFILLAGLFNSQKQYIFNALTALTAALSLAFVIAGGMTLDVSLFDNMMRRDGMGDFLIILVDIGVILTCLMSIHGKPQRNASEYYAFILTIALGSHLLVMSTSLVMIFLSLEVISISSYILVGYSFNRVGSEGSLKYFLFGSIASAVTIYGFSILYGLSGTVDITSKPFFDALVDQHSPLLFIGGLMGLAGFLFKLAAVPMQPWAPDVYEAAPMPVVAYLSVAPKVAALGVLAKFILAMHLFGRGVFDWQLIVSVIAILSITVGNLSALWQKNAKRMMAYSSIAHSGFLLVGIAAFLPQGFQFMMFYAAVYLVMNFSVFTFLAHFEERGISSMPSFAGIGKKEIFASVGITIALVALTGLPPTAGFTAKLLIFSGLWESYIEHDKSLLLWLLIIGLFNTVISLFFYMRIPYYAFIKAGTSNLIEKRGGLPNFLGLILVVVIVVLFFIPGMLMGLINRINFAL